MSGTTRWYHAGAGYVLAGLILTFVHTVSAGFIDLAVIKQMLADQKDCTIKNTGKP